MTTWLNGTMIDHLKQMALFTHVVAEGSLRAAAKRVGLSLFRMSGLAR